MTSEPPRYIGRIHLRPDALIRGPIPSPTHSFLLGDPHPPNQGTACNLTLNDAAAFATGYTGEVHIELIYDTELGRGLPPSMPVWYGTFIGEITDIRRIDS